MKIRRKTNRRGAPTYVASSEGGLHDLEREAHSPIWAVARLVGARWFERRIARRAGCSCGSPGEPETIAERRDADAFIDTITRVEAITREILAAIRKETENP